MEKLEDQILDKVYKFETKRTLFDIISRVFLIGFLFFLIYFFTSILWEILKEQGTFGLLAILNEDIEVVRKYLLDNIYIFYQETPKIILIFSLIPTTLFIIVIFLFIKNFKKIKKKFISITKHWVSNKSVTKKITKISLFIFAVIIILKLIPLNPLPTSTSVVIPSPSAVVTQNKNIFLEIIFPLNGSRVKNSQVILKGKTVPNVDVFVNENELEADSEGNFSSNVNLDEGENIINVLANDNQGNYAEKEITVDFEIGER